MLGDGCPLASQGHKGKTWHDSLLHCQWGPPIKHFFWALGQRSGEKRGIYASLHLNPRQNPKRQLSLTKRSLLITRSSSSNAAEARKYPSPLSFPESNKKKKNATSLSPRYTSNDFFSRKSCCGPWFSRYTSGGYRTYRRKKGSLSSALFSRVSSADSARSWPWSVAEG